MLPVILLWMSDEELLERVQELTQIPAYQRRADTAQDVPGGADDKEPAEK